MLKNKKIVHVLSLLSLFVDKFCMNKLLLTADNLERLFY